MNIHLTEGRKVIPITTSPEVPEDVIPSVSPIARPDQCEGMANFIWNDSEKVLSRWGEAIRELNGGLPCSKVDGDSYLGRIKEILSELCDDIEGQKAIQIEYRRGDRM